MFKIRALFGLLITLIMLINTSFYNPDDENIVANYELTYETSVETSSEVLVGETIKRIVLFRVTN